MYRYPAPFSLLLRAALLLWSCSQAPLLFAALDVEVQGAEETLATNVRRHIGDIEPAQADDRERLRRRVQNSIREASEALGYYRAEFRLERRDDKLIVHLEPGDPVVWARPVLRVAGPAQKSGEVRKLLADHPFNPGERINHEQYERFKQRLFNACHEQGYLDTRYREAELLVNLNTGRATARLLLNCGRPYYLADIDVSGTAIDAQLLKDLTGIEPGQRYRPEQRVQLVRNLQQSGYFRNVEVNIRKLADARVVAAIRVQERDDHHFDVGVGFGTDTGVRGTFRWEIPHVNEAGHKLTSEIEASGIEQSAGTRYTIPLRDPLHRQLNYTALYESKDNRDTDTTRLSVGAAITDERKEDWLFTYGASYEYEKYQQGGEPETTTRYLLPAVSATYARLPTEHDWHAGRKVWAELSGSDPALGADTSFVRLHGGATQVIDITDRQRLILRGQAGIITTDEIRDIPASLRFFTGGDKTVRGYDYETLAPRNENGELIGGKFVNVVSVEYNFLVKPQWRAALFVDSGRAFNDKDAPWNTGIGPGVRWVSPLGQVGVDIAFPLDDDRDGFRLHIVIGPPL